MNSPLDLLRLEVRFPLADGRELVQGPLTYNQDGLATRHSAAFMLDSRFTEAYRVGLENAASEVRIEWRVHVALWCANQAARLEGDFVECGVHTGILAGAVMTWLDFAQHLARTFYLFDTWTGIPAEQVSEEEKALGALRSNPKYQDGDANYARALAKFSRWPNAKVIRGRVPESLQAMAHSEKVAYCSIDMNVAAAEMAAIEFLWPRLVPGAVLLIDDYGWAAHGPQKRAWDAWAASAGIMILTLPTGQGLVIKPT